MAELEQAGRSGQPICLMDLAAAAHREEREKKKSVMEQLKSQPKAEHKKTAPKKSTEREISIWETFTFEEMNLMCIYNTGSRTGLIDSLREMPGELAGGNRAAGVDRQRTGQAPGHE